MRGLFVNTRRAQCSIYESGIMVYEILKEKYDLGYCETGVLGTCSVYDIPNGYDFFVINWHHMTMPLPPETLSELQGVKIAMVLEMVEGNPFVAFPSNFDEYMVLDPTMRNPDPRTNPFPRPLEEIAVPPYEDTVVPTIGSFGFSTADKRFDLVVEQTAKEFEIAVVRINIPAATFWDCDGSKTKSVVDQCLAKARPGITVSITHNYFNKPELVKWCSTNTINCFLYQRQMPGLAAVTDQAISSGRPLLVSDCDTFRHVHQYLTPFPRTTIRRAITESVSGVQAMKRDWSRESFAGTFKKLLAKRGLG